MTRRLLRFNAAVRVIQGIAMVALGGMGCMPAGCDREVEPPAGASQPVGCTDRFMFIDDTRSVAGPDDRKRWLGEALAYVGHIAACDTLAVMWIDDATS